MLTARRHLHPTAPPLQHTFAAPVTVARSGRARAPAGCAARRTRCRWAARSGPVRAQVFMLSADQELTLPTLQSILSSGHSRIPIHKPGARYGPTLPYSSGRSRIPIHKPGAQSGPRLRAGRSRRIRRYWWARPVRPSGSTRCSSLLLGCQRAKGVPVGIARRAGLPCAQRRRTRTCPGDARRPPASSRGCSARAAGRTACCKATCSAADPANGGRGARTGAHARCGAAAGRRRLAWSSNWAVTGGGRPRR
jgi:hypothetical protein